MTKENARTLAMTALLQVEEGASAQVALTAAFAQTTLDARDRGLLTELVDGTLRWQGRLDYQLQQLLERPLEQLPVPIKLVLRLGAYQLTRLERVPAHAAVNEAVSLAHHYGHAGTAKLVNAVLRRLEREQATLPFPDPETDPVAYLSSAYSHPAWLVERWLPRFGFAETEALLQSDNNPSPVTLRINQRWISRPGLQQFLSAHGLETAPTAISPNGLLDCSGGNPREMDEYREGLFSVQGEGSMIMVELLRPGRRRAGWDLAAGVGGKATYLAEWVDDTGSLLATDPAVDRLNVLQHETKRLGLHSIEVRQGDARTFPVAPDSMDYALLDAPCSGTGALRRQADARWKKTVQQIVELTVLQRELLEAAARAVKPEGLLLYCTCSLEPEENEILISAFLAEHPEWRLLPAGEKHPGLPDDARDPAGYVRLLPHRHGTDGFFAARMTKVANGSN